MGMTLKGEVSIGGQWGRPLNVESRGQGFQSNYFYIYEFMGGAQDTDAAMEERDKTEPAEESRCWIG